MPMTVARRSRGLLVVAGTLWGTGGLTGALLAREADLDALAVATFRLGLGGLFILGFAALTGRPWPRAAPQWRRIAVIGGLAAAFQACYFAAVQRTAVSLATLLTIGAAPVLVLVVEAVTGRRRVGARALVTALVALAGLVLLIGVPETGRSLTGPALALLAAAAFAAMTLVGSRPAHGLDDLTGTGLAFLAGAALLAPLAGAGLAVAPTGPTVSLLVVFGLLPTAVAYAAYFRGLRGAPAGTAALLALLEPLVGTLLAVLVLGDRLGPAAIVGAALLLAALTLEATGHH
jgi:DME family drug/metabolite transporter